MNTLRHVEHSPRSGATMLGMDSPSTPTSAGFYWYTDQPGAPRERIEVLRDGSTLVARFSDDDGDPEFVPVADMAGDFAPA
jgi:hypothetical protein